MTDIKGDTYIHKYGMTIDEIAAEVRKSWEMSTNGRGSEVIDEKISEQIRSVYRYIGSGSIINLPHGMTVSAATICNKYDIVDENHVSDQEIWEHEVKPKVAIDPAFGAWGGFYPSYSPDNAWNPSEIYVPSWKDKEEKVTECLHTKTRDVELFYSVATECVDCGKRIK